MLVFDRADFIGAIQEINISTLFTLGKFNTVTDSMHLIFLRIHRKACHLNERTPFFYNRLIYSFMFETALNKRTVLYIVLLKNAKIKSSSTVRIFRNPRNKD